MTLRECYDSINSDFDKAVARMCGKESMLAKFAKKFPNDPTYTELISSFEKGDMPTAFRMAHTLKGLCLNLGLDKLQASSSELTEALRNTEAVADNAAELFEQVKQDYEMTVNAINSVDDQ